jgi:hypothetical protein
VVSGGQTGADRAALDVALAWGLELGGWVPAGRAAEDGRIPDSYPGLRETDEAGTAERTCRNVRDSDATLIVSRGPLSGGSRFTFETARRLDRPVLHVDLDRVPIPEAVRHIASWLDANRAGTLNVAGPRASAEPRIHADVSLVLAAVLGRLDTPRQTRPTGEDP